MLDLSIDIFKVYNLFCLRAISIHIFAENYSGSAYLMVQYTGILPLQSGFIGKYIGEIPSHISHTEDLVRSDTG